MANPHAVSLEPDRRHQDPFNLGVNALTSSSDAPFIWNVLMSLHILLLSAPSPLLLHPLLLEVVGAVKHIKKRKHELTSEEHQSSFNLNFSAGFCSCFYMKEVAFVAPCTCSCFLQGGQTESFSGL